MPKPLPDDLRERIKNDIRAGTKTAGQIARDHGIARSTVTRIGKQLEPELGHPPFERSQTKKATEAALVDAKELRAKLATGALSMAQTVLASFEDVDWSEVSPYSRAVIFGILVERGSDLAKDEGAAEQEAASLISELVQGIRDRRGGSDEAA